MDHAHNGEKKSVGSGLMVSQRRTCTHATNMGHGTNRTGDCTAERSRPALTKYRGASHSLDLEQKGSEAGSGSVGLIG